MVWWLMSAASLRPGKSPGRGNRQGVPWRAWMSATAAFRNNRRSCDASFASCPRFPRAERDRSRRSQDSIGSPRSRLRRHWERPLLASFSGSAA